jgi:two-component system, LytTR family, sensor kinase
LDWQNGRSSIFSQIQSGLGRIIKRSFERMTIAEADLSKTGARSLKNRVLWILLGHRTYWLGQLAAWTGIWLLFCAIFVSALSDIRTTYFLVDQACFCVLGLAATHLLRATFFSLRWDRLGIASQLPRILAVILLLSGAESWTFTSLRPPLHKQVSARLVQRTEPFGPRIRRGEGGEAAFPSVARFSFEFAKSLLTLFAWAAIYFGYRLQQMLKTVQFDRLRLDAAVKESELKALRSQVNPHFLFNSLNTIRALIDEDRLKAREGITRLAELFRASLRSSEVDTVSLRTELQTVNAYLALEKLRFEDRLQFRMEVDPKAMEMTIPPFVLQTIIENAFKHGIYPQSAGGVIRCVIRAMPTGMALSVTNPGRLPPPEKYRESGIANVRGRLKLIYGADAKLDIVEDEQKLVTVNMFLPQS